MPESLLVQIAVAELEKLRKTHIAPVFLNGQLFFLVTEQTFPSLTSEMFSYVVGEQEVQNLALEIAKAQREGLRATGGAVVTFLDETYTLLNLQAFEGLQELLIEHQRQSAFVAALLVKR